MLDLARICKKLIFSFFLSSGQRMLEEFQQRLQDEEKKFVFVSLNVYILFRKVATIYLLLLLLENNVL